MIADFTIDQPALLENNLKILTMGGAIIILSKKWPLFVHRLSVFMGVLGATKVRSPAPPKKLKRLAGSL
jgi:hypothetical protein